MSDKPALKCKYRYEPLDRWVGSQQTALSDCHLFYRKKHLTTCLQGYQSTRLFQHEDLLLAQQDDAQAQLYITDRQRTVSGVPSTGRSHQRFTPYGYCSALHGFSSLLKFNGERPDPVTGHYLLGNGYRAYNPVLMRFNSPDSLSPFAEGGVNAYSYCLGDPVNRQDRDGHMSLGIMATVLKAVTRFKAPLKLKISNLPDVPFHKIIAHLNGADMTSLASTSKWMHQRVLNNVQPLAYLKPLAASAASTPDYIVGLRNISLGNSNGHLPSQVLRHPRLMSDATGMAVSDTEPGRSYLLNQYKKGLRDNNDKHIQRLIKAIRKEKVAHKKATYGEDVHSDTSYDSDDSYI